MKRVECEQAHVRQANVRCKLHSARNAIQVDAASTAFDQHLIQPSLLGMSTKPCAQAPRLERGRQRPGLWSNLLHMAKCFLLHSPAQGVVPRGSWLLPHTGRRPAHMPAQEATLLMASAGRQQDKKSQVPPVDPSCDKFAGPWNRETLLPCAWQQTTKSDPEGEHLPGRGPANQEPCQWQTPRLRTGP
eukprot:1160921-Pelagomonas_calceolata.AAC.12